MQTDGQIDTGTPENGSSGSQDFKSLYLVYDKRKNDWIKKYQEDHVKRRELIQAKIEARKGRFNQNI